MQLFNDFSQLIFPTRCFGCQKLAPTICSACRSQWHPHYYKSTLEDLTIHSAVLYSPTASKIIVAAKESGIKQADDLLIHAIEHVLRKARINSNFYRLVPIPSSKSSQRRRGRSFMVDITQEVSNRTGIALLNCLELSRKVADQSGLNRQQRGQNMHGAFELKSASNLSSAVRGGLILIDDVVTTGATLKEAARAIKSQGAHALGSISAVTACVAQPLR